MTGRKLIVTASALPWRSALEPTAWLVLEELAIDCRVDGKAANSPHNSQSLGESLGRSKDAVARALRGLIDAGLIERVIERDPHTSRFTSGHYAIDLQAAGLLVVDETNDDVLDGQPQSVTGRVSTTSKGPVQSRSLRVGDEELAGGWRSTNLHPGAAPRGARPAPGRADPVGTMGRTSSPPGWEEPGLFDPGLEGR